MLKTLKKIIPPATRQSMAERRNRLFDRYATKSYSQEGEDMILQRLFAGQDAGFYVDVGAHHPQRFSNTYLFYKKGWDGINIEPNPDAMLGFQNERRRDINLQLGVSDTATTLKYYSFDEPALNTFDENIVRSRLATTTYKHITTQEIQVDRLENILRQYLPANQKIDFLTIDVEGLDLKVLKSNDWQQFRPRCVLAEALNMSLEEAMSSEVFLFMKGQEYELFAKTYNTLIFCDKRV